MHLITNIDNVCYQSYPCQHYVTFDDGSKELVYFPAILVLCVEQSFPIPHRIMDEYTKFYKNDCNIRKMGWAFPPQESISALSSCLKRKKKY